jgi:hypothetical protein
MGRTYITNGDEEECIYDIGVKARRKESLGRPRSRRLGNIKIDFRETR